MTLRWTKPERNIDDTIVEFDACSFSTLSVTDTKEANFELSPNDESTCGEDEDTSEEYGSSFLSVEEANSDNIESTVRELDQETVTIYERKPILTQSDIDNEILCEFCVEIKATHFCKLCKGDGMRMCHRCLRCHTRLTNHQSGVMSLTSNTESLNLVHGSKERRSNDIPLPLPPDKVVDWQPSPPVLKLCHLNIVADKDTSTCTAIDFTRMANGNLLVADFSNKCLKIFNFDNLHLENVFYLDDHPVCITCFPNNTVAVAYIKVLCLEKIEESHERLAIYKEMDNCNGLKSVGEYLYYLGGTSCTASIYHQQGSKNLSHVRTIELKQYGINHPEQIDVDQSRNTIYITDAALYVYALDVNEKLLMSMPMCSKHDVSSDTASNVYVCYFNSNKVLRITKKASSCKTFLPGDTIAVQCSVYFDHKRRRIFIGMYKNNLILYTDIND